MLKKYNIALIPCEKSAEIISCAKNFSDISDKYLLGDHSLPHVTIYQFDAESSEILPIIEKVNAASVKKTIELIFEDFSCITFDKIIHWVSLMPDQVDVLNEMHEIIAGILNKPIKPNYDPHMTLMSTKFSDYEDAVEMVKRQYVPITDKFKLTIGESDEVGQYLKMISDFGVDK